MVKIYKLNFNIDGYRNGKKDMVNMSISGLSNQMLMCLNVENKLIVEIGK